MKNRILTEKASEKFIKTLEYFLQLDETDEIYSLIFDEKISTDLVLDKLNEFYTSYNMHTDKFKDANDLNIFITNVQSCRDAQKKVEEFIKNNDELSLHENAFQLLKSEKETFEQQLDRDLEALPTVHAIFL